MLESRVQASGSEVLRAGKREGSWALEEAGFDQGSEVQVQIGKGSKPAQKKGPEVMSP